jgi:hypothetical protein
MSKEEIIKRGPWYMVQIGSGMDQVGREAMLKENVLDAMDAYAKQVAIGFAEWRINARAHWSYHYDIWSFGGEMYTTPQLFEKYLQTLQPSNL